MANTTLTIAALEASVQNAWDRAGVGRNRRAAQLAVAEVIDALRGNPAWANALLLGTEPTAGRS